MIIVALPMKTEIIEELKGLDVVEWGCNCLNCSRERFIRFENAILLKIAPNILKRLDRTLPLIYDKQGNYNNKHSNLTLLTNQDRWYEILSCLERRETENKEWRKAHPHLRSRICINCGKQHIPVPDQTIVFSNKKYFLCVSCCLDYRRCVSCGLLKRDGKFHTVGKRKRVCDQCYLENYFRCRECGLGIHKDKKIIVFYKRSGFHEVCKHCSDTSKVKCQECGKESYSFVGENLYDHENNKVHFCAECTEKRTAIQDHNYLPMVRHFHKGIKEGKVTDKGLYFGFELEVENQYSYINRAAMAVLVKEKYGSAYIYVMGDATLEDGIEIVSYPFTWDKYKESIDKWNDLLLYLRSKNWKANTKKVGFHVHMTKAAFTTFHLFKFLKFFYQEHNRNFICTIAQREPEMYWGFGEANNVVVNAKDKNNRNQADHYHVVNLNKKDTIEIRMFKGTLEPLYFNKNIEFLHAIFKYSRDYGPNMMKYDHFVPYLQKCYKQYPCLWEFLTNVTNKISVVKKVT